MKIYARVDLGNITNFLGIQRCKHKDGTIELTQPQLIESILNDLSFQANTKMKEIPALAMVILQKDMKWEDLNKKFHYRSIIRKLNFLKNQPGQIYHMLFTNVQDFQKTPSNHMERQFDN